MTTTLPTPSEVFGIDDLAALSRLVADAWTAAADLDWSVPAEGLDWTCLATADHAVDCVYAPAFFLASRRTDAYPEAGGDLTLGERATPALLVQSLELATRLLVAVARDAPPDTRTILFGGPTPVLGAPVDFLPRAALELALHAHDVCAGLGVAFAVPAGPAARLRDHTRGWAMWERAFGSPLPSTADPWADLLRGSGRRPPTVGD